MTDVSKLLLKLSNKLFSAAQEREAFIQALANPKPYPSCILWVDSLQDGEVRTLSAALSRPNPLPFSIEPSLPWQPKFIDRLSVTEKPGAHPLHEAGAYYCLDFSSVFAASVIEVLPERPKAIVDICAAPGGKSIFAWQRFHPDQLVSNETIGKRVGMLIGNLKRCRIHPAIVLSTDPSQLSLRLPQTANLVLVDAPCSGQSLLAKGGQAEGCFHPVTIKQNAQRQKRILAHAAQIVAPQGYLVYMTCTFSPEENERVGQWLLRKFPQLEARPVNPLVEYQSHLTDLPCYRIWPQSGLGAGAFAMLFQNTETGPTQPLPTELWPGWRWSSSVQG